MAFVGIRIPPEIVSRISLIDVPGEKTEIGEYHITLVYLGDGIDFIDLVDVMAVCRMALKDIKPFLVGSARVTKFEKSKNIPNILRIQSIYIESLRNKIMKLFDEYGISYINNHPEFIPHITLSYSDDIIDDFPINPIIWNVNSITIWGADHGQGNMSADLEFGFI